MSNYERVWRHLEEFLLNCQGSLCSCQTCDILWLKVPFLHVADSGCIDNVCADEGWMMDLAEQS